MLQLFGFLGGGGAMLPISGFRLIPRKCSTYEPIHQEKNISTIVSHQSKSDEVYKPWTNLMLNVIFTRVPFCHRAWASSSPNDPSQQQQNHFWGHWFACICRKHVMQLYRLCFQKGNISTVQRTKHEIKFRLGCAD